MTNFLSRMKEMADTDPNIVILWLYGSRATGNFTSESDYDLAVAFNTYIDDPLERRLRPELLALEWAHTLEMPENKISIVDINLVPIALGWGIISQGKTLVVKDEVRLFKEEWRIRSMYEIDVKYHWKHYE